jgi:uncharacterized membrane protein YccC
MTLLQRLLGTALGLVFLLAVFVFASLALGVMIAVGLVLWAWHSWRARSLHQGGRVIEGEYRDETRLERLHDREDPRRL